MPNLKPLSDLEREILAALGETPAHHQQALLRIKKAPAKELNKHLLQQVYGIGHDKPQASAKEILESQAKPGHFDPEAWVPHHYVMFSRRSTCLHCKRTEATLDRTELFLCHAKRGERTSPISARTGRDLSVSINSRLYLPVREISHPTLPRLLEVSVKTSPFCYHCFGDAQWPDSSSISSQASIASLELEAPSSTESEQPTSKSAFASSPTLDSSEEASVGSVDSATSALTQSKSDSPTETGGDFDSFANVQLPVDAAPIYSLIEEHLVAEEKEANG